MSTKILLEEIGIFLDERGKYYTIPTNLTTRHYEYDKNYDGIIVIKDKFGKYGSIDTEGNFTYAVVSECGKYSPIFLPKNTVYIGVYCKLCMRHPINMSLEEYNNKLNFIKTDENGFKYKDVFKYNFPGTRTIVRNYANEVNEKYTVFDGNSYFCSNCSSFCFDRYDNKENDDGDDDDNYYHDHDDHDDYFDY